MMLGASAGLVALSKDTYIKRIFRSKKIYNHIIQFTHILKGTEHLIFGAYLVVGLMVVGVDTFS